MDKLTKILDIFKKGIPLVTGLFEASMDADARKAAGALLKATGSEDTEPTDADLDEVDATLDRLLDKFNEPMKPRNV